jgi:hypothetical protein
MKRTTLGLLAATALTAAIPGFASAQNMSARESQLDARIEAGIRSGTLTRYQGNVLFGDVDRLVAQEMTYRRDGRLTDWERNDLEDRYNALLARIGDNRGPGYDNWQPINARQDNLFRRIDQGVRAGGLTRAEGERLRADFYAIVRLEDQYRRNGLTQWERQDLDRRLDTLAQRIRMERRDGQQAGRFDFGQRIAALGSAIDRAIRSGWVSNSEANDLRYRHRELASVDVRYRSGGYTNGERADLDSRIANLETRLEADAGRDFGFLGGNYYR